MRNVPSFLLGQAGYAAVRDRSVVRLFAAGFKRYDASIPNFERGEQPNEFFFFHGDPEEEPGPIGWFSFVVSEENFEVTAEKVAIHDTRGRIVVDVRELYGQA